MKILFDENIPHHFAEFLHRAGAPGQVQHIRRLGWNGKPDLEWMRLAIQAGFGILTADRNDRTRGLTVRDLKAMGARVLFLGSFWDDLPIWSKAKWVISKWEILARAFDEMQDGSCALVVRSGKIVEL